MVLTKVQIKIIKLLIAADDYVSSYEIAVAAETSRRSVRDKMQEVKSILAHYGYTLISKQSKGYIIEGKSSTSMDQLSQIIQESEKTRETMYPDDASERSNYIIRRLILADDYIKIDDFANELLISRTTLSSEMKYYRSIAQRTGLTLVHKSNYGIAVHGSELGMRQCLCDLVFSALSKAEMLYDYLSACTFASDGIENAIIQVLDKHQIMLSDIGLIDLLICLTVAVQRDLDNHPLTNIRDITPIANRKEYDAAVEITQLINNHFHIEFTEAEIRELLIWLVCKRSVKNLPDPENPMVYQIAKSALDSIYAQTGLVFNNEEFQSDFYRYIDVSILRAFYRDKIRHPLFQTVLKEFPLSYHCATLVSQQMENIYGSPLSSSQLAFFATMFKREITRTYSKKCKALLVCGIGSGIDFYSFDRLSNRFHNSLELFGPISFHAMSTYDLSKFDFVITTFNIEQELPIPSVRVSPFVNADDIKRIRSYLSFHQSDSQLLESFHPNLFSHLNHIEGRADLYNAFQKILIAQFPNQKSILKNKIHMSNVEYHTVYQNVLLIRTHSQILSRAMVPVIVLDKPYRVDGKSIRIVMLYCCDEMNQIYNRLQTILTQIPASELKSFCKNPSYPALMNFFK